MLSIILAGIAMFLFGAFWFTVLFGKKWAELMGFTAEKMSPEEQLRAKEMGMVKPLILNFISNLIVASVVYYLFPQLFTLSYIEFLKIMLVIWLGFSFPVYANYAIWERKTWTLVAINCAQSLISLVLVTSIIYSLN